MPNQIDGFLEGTILGGVIGAAFGILYASYDGRKTRRNIKGKTAKLLAEA